MYINRLFVINEISTIFLSINSDYMVSELQVEDIRRTKDYRVHKMNIKGIYVQGGVDCFLIKMCWMIDSMEFDPGWRLLNMSQIPN